MFALKGCFAFAQRLASRAFHCQDMPPRGPITAEVLDVMPHSLGFIVRVMRNNKVGQKGLLCLRCLMRLTFPTPAYQAYQGICVQQEGSAKAALPRSRFSRAVTAANYAEHQLGVDGYEQFYQYSRKFEISVLQGPCLA